jgi:DNA-binding transcriptional LysR family regulator
MDFDKLKTFYQVASVGGISEAVNALAMDKSTISRQLALLEKQVGAELFYRQKNQLVLTLQGEYLFKKAGNILMEIEAIKETIASDQQQIDRSFTISTTYPIASTWLTYFLDIFIEQHPQVQLNIKATTEPLNLSLREADVAIRPYCSDQDDLVQDHLMQWRLNLFASDSYIKRFGMPKDVEDLYHHRLIVLGDASALYPSSYTNWPLTLGVKNGKLRKPFLVINSLEGMYNLVCKGIGIGYFGSTSPLFIRQKLLAVLPEQMHHPIDVYYIYQKQFAKLELIQKFKSFLLSQTKQIEA